jgi:hypothetical protein
LISKFPNLFDIENKKDRYLLSIYAYANKDDIIYDLLTASDKLGYIKESSELNLKRISKDKSINIEIKDASKKIIKSNEDKKEIIKNEISEITTLIKDNNFESVKSTLMKQREELEKELEDLEIIKEFDDLYKKDTKEEIKEIKKNYLTDHQNEFIPHVVYTDEQTRDILLNSIDQASSYVVNKNKYLKFMMSDILEKYD